jgi:hypothetical protein
MKFKNEYVPRLRRRVSQNNRFEVINNPKTVVEYLNKYKYVTKKKPGVRVQLKTNMANKVAAIVAKSKGYTTTNLRIVNAMGKHTVYKKNLNGKMYVKYEASNKYTELHPNVVVRKANGNKAKVGNLNANNNYSNLNIGTYVNIVPVNNNNSVYIYEGHTAGSKRQLGYGTALRRFAMNAARNAGIKLYQVSMNVEGLLHGNANKTPYSGRIMQRLGAQRVQWSNVPKSIRTGHSTNMWFVYK